MIQKGLIAFEIVPETFQAVWSSAHRSTSNRSGEIPSENDHYEEDTISAITFPSGTVSIKRDFARARWPQRLVLWLTPCGGASTAVAAVSAA